MPTLHLPRQTTIYTCGAACLAAICALLEAGSLFKAWLKRVATCGMVS